MTHVHCQWLTWIQYKEKHVWGPVQSSWASQENESELLGSGLPMTHEANSSRGLPMTRVDCT
eukprot:11298212-Karenia_brevis.AAC.1